MGILDPLLRDDIRNLATALLNRWDTSDVDSDSDPIEISKEVGKAAFGTR